jgi:hypothetical protein
MYCSSATGHRFLRLHHLDVARDAGGETVPRLRQLLRGQLTRFQRTLALCGRRLQVEECHSDVVVNLCFQVLGFGATVAQGRLGFEQAPLNAPTVEQGHAHRADDRVCAAGVAWRQADRAEVRVDVERR